MRKAKESKGEGKSRKQTTTDLVVFAMRLPAEERDLIHKVAGAGGATRFVRAAALAAAKGDTKTFGALSEQAKSNLK